MWKQGKHRATFFPLPSLHPLRIGNSWARVILGPLFLIEKNLKNFILYKLVLFLFQPIVNFSLHDEWILEINYYISCMDKLLPSVSNFMRIPWKYPSSCDMREIVKIIPFLIFQCHSRSLSFLSCFFSKAQVLIYFISTSKDTGFDLLFVLTTCLCFFFFSSANICDLRQLTKMAQSV